MVTFLKLLTSYALIRQGLKAGDLKFLKDPWGIGPRDEEYTDEVSVFCLLYGMAV